MAKFDPDAYLRETAPAATAPQQDFDPSVYLRGASAPPTEAVPGPRRSYAATEVPIEAVKNIPGSAKQFATGIYEAVRHPIDTLSAVADVGAGALRLALPKQVVSFFDQFDANPQATQRAMDAAKQVGGAIADRYGSWDSIKRTVAEDPVGAAGDLSTLLSGAGAVVRPGAGGVSAMLTGTASIARMTGAGRAAGALERAAPVIAGPIARTADVLESAATATNPVSAVTIPAQAGLEQVRRVMPSPLTAQQAANAPRDLALERARSEGFVAPPGSIDPVSGKYVVAERIAGKTMLEQLMSVRNQEQTNRLARRAVGLANDTPLTSDSMQAVRRQAAQQGYQPVQQIGNIAVDNQYLNALAGIEQAFVGQAASFPAAVPQTVRQLVGNHLVANFDSADAIRRIQDLRNDAGASFRRNEPDIGRAQRALAAALEDQIERGITASGAPNAAEMLDNFRAARQRMAISHSIEDAVREGTGNVSAAKLANDLQGGRYLSGDLLTISEFANRFPRVSRLPSDIGTPSSGSILGMNLPQVVGGAIGALGGAAVAGLPGASAGLVAGPFATNMLSAGMRRYLMSEGAQRGATPRYDPMAERLISDITARNALMAEQADEVRRQRNALMGVQ